MTDPVRMGIVGCSHACKDLHRPWLANMTDKFDVRSLFDLNKELAESEAKEFGGNAVAEDSLESMLSRDDIEVVAVWTKPPTTHYIVAKQVLAAGKDCWIEKPFAQTAEECDELLELANKKGVNLFVHQNRRWDANYQQAKEIYDSGKLGVIDMVQVGFGPFSLDWGVHVIDQALRFGNGKLLQVYGWSPNADAPEGKPATVDFIFERPPAVRIQFMPTSPATLDIQKFARFYLLGNASIKDGRKFDVVPTGEDWPDQAQMYRHLYAWMREGAPRPIDPIGARNAIYAADLMLESARLKKSITPDKWMMEEDAPSVV